MSSLFNTPKARRLVLIAAWREFEERHGPEALRQVLRTCGNFNSPQAVPEVEMEKVLEALAANKLDSSARYLPPHQRSGARSRLRPWRELI
jgi:hypothetical protein